MPAAQAEIAAPPASEGEWVKISTASALMNLTPSGVRKNCERAWEAQGLARKADGEWMIHRSADPRLRTTGYVNSRDLEQLADAAARRMKPRYLDIAKARKRVILAWERADKSPNVDIAFPRCMAGLLAEGGILEALGKAPAMTTVYRWQSDYAAGGIEALIPKSQKSGRGRWAQTGAKAIERLCHWMLGGSAMGFRPAYVTVAGEIELEHRNDPE